MKKSKQRQEGSNINTSLLALASCIKLLTERSKNKDSNTLKNEMEEDINFKKLIKLMKKFSLVKSPFGGLIQVLVTKKNYNYQKGCEI